MTAERIAEVVADIRAGRVQHPGGFDEQGIIHSLQLLDRAQQPQPVVDCTAVAQGVRQLDSVALYGDHPSIVPPWTDALLCYVNTYGNVIVLQVHRRDHDGTVVDSAKWVTENDVDWARVRWIAETSVWVGGLSTNTGRAIPTSGPCHLLRHAIRGDGAPEDINWIALMARRGQFGAQIDDPAADLLNGAIITLGASLNFLGASNVDVAEPARPRPERRRLARTGVQVQTIVVRPPGKRRASSAAVRPISADEAVFSPVRGHWARYGPAYDRGLLFGRYSGKFWVSAHTRGAGDTAKDYVLKPGQAA